MRARIALISLVAAILSALLLAPALVFPYFEDAALFAAVANYMLEGETLYRDVFDHKAPAIYLQEMIRISLFGTSALASRVVELAFLFLAGLGLGASALALRSDDHQGPSLALLLLLPVSFCAFTSSTIWILPDRGQVEFFQAAVVALGLSAALFSIALPDRRLPALVSGMALAWAAWLKPQASVLLVFFFLVLLWEGVRTNRGKRRAWDLTFGVVIVSVVFAVFVMISGSLDGFFHLFSKHHPAYLAGVRPVPSNLFDRFTHYFLSTPRNLVVAALTALGAVRLAWLARRRSIRWASWLLIVGTLAWGLAAFASGVAGFRYHAVPAMVGVSVLVAWGMEGLLHLATGTRDSWWRTVAGGTLLGLIGVWLIATPRFLVDTADLAGWWSGREALASVHERRGNEAHYYSYARELEASRIVREIVPEGQSIYVLGLAGVTYLLGERPTAGRHLVTTFAYMPGYSLADSVHQEIVETVRDQQPELLLVRTNDSFPWFGLPYSSVQRLMQDKALLPIVRQHYRPAGRIGDYFLILQRCPGLSCAESRPTP
ncbi:MAG: hypothetical protein WBN87_03810 [Thermoanaerobaculia bacterium]